MTKKVKVTPTTVYVSGGKGPKKTPVDPSEVVVKRGKTAVPDKYSGGKGRGKWWNPPKKSAVKGLDEITKDLEKKAEPTKRKRAPWTKMKGLGLIGGGGKK